MPIAIIGLVVIICVIYIFFIVRAILEIIFNKAHGKWRGNPNNKSKSM
jgi:hypothetical protein